MVSERERSLLRAALRAGIDEPGELANLMAQTAHESRNLTRLEESFRYSKGVSQIPVKRMQRPEIQATAEQARRQALQGHPQHLAELMYGGRLGNDQPGDGYRYRGRGYIQLTGKDNYRQAGAALGLDLIDHPELAAEPENVERIAIWYWQARVRPAHRQDVRKATRDINGAETGLAERRALYAAWMDILTPQLIAELGRQPAPNEGEVGSLAEA